MANQIPLAEGTDPAGGYLVHDTYGSILQLGVLRKSAVMQLARVDRVSSKRQLYNVYSGRPTAGFVAEGAAKPVTGAEFTSLSINVKKIAAIVRYTEEMLEDAIVDPESLLGPDVEAAIADLIDANALGYANGTAIVGNFDAEAAESSMTVEMGNTGDGLAVAISAAIGMIEANGYSPSGICLAQDMKGNLRDARSALDATRNLYGGDQFGAAPDSMYGLPFVYTTNLDGLPAAAGKVAAVVGDWRNAIFTLRKDMTFKRSTEATVGGVSMFETNGVAALWETRIGFNVFDLNRSFVKITNAS